ncbi:hypothetical protein FGG08_001704 [Glutinoglossum americanum]|uniref:Peroxin 20 n=1 Tax=Glutinoglossum americanum TaxID=1670608 RepID=A0A9P8I7S9_9PEZI|nr:hypothetical protein FGG08_001704 [Glutinoglossum americanum]
MAESTLCGPSNALHGLQKHATIDRTLQQDRLVARHPSSQGFRSSAGPNIGVLDPEFEAFQAGSVPPPELQSHHFAQSPNIPPTHIPDWASDFQRLHVSQRPSPIAQLQHRSQAPIQGATTGGWHQEFLQAQNSVRQGSTQNLGAQGNFGGIGMTGFGMQGPSLYGGMSVGIQGSEAHTQYLVPQEGDEIYDDAAFERAFEAANSELVQQGSLESERDLPREESADALDGHGSSVDAEKEVEQRQHDEQGEEDPDELARTAGQLLDSVKDNQSQKFQESTFLSLMRRIRDREVRVEGDKMVEVGNTPSATADDHL